MANEHGLSGVGLHLVNTVEKANEFITWLGERRPNDLVSVDIETGELPGNPTGDALSPWRGKIRTAQVGDGQQGFCIPWEEWSGVYYQGMGAYTGEIACHNLAFEAKWFDLQSRWDLPWHKAHDTMIMSRIIDPQRPAGLKPLASHHIDARAVAMQETLSSEFSKRGWTWGSVPVDYQPYWMYAALDTVLTTKLYDKFIKQCGPGAVYHTPYELEMNALRIATRMELNGARVDLEYSQQKLDELERFVATTKKWVYDNYGGINSGSSVQLIRVFEGMGERITEVTKTGQKSMTEDQLDIFVREGSPAAQTLAGAVIKQRKASKLASAYFSNFITENENGFVHASINTLAARTGRMSISNPALQTLPKRDPTVRRAFLPKDDDHCLITSDLDQVEFRIAANISQDPDLIRLFMDADASGGDAFVGIMRQVYDDEKAQKSDPRRNLIKATVYGKLFGAGVTKMASSAGVSSLKMKEVVDAFDANYPGIKRLQKDIEKLGMQRLNAEGKGYIVTRTGRRLPCDEDRVYALMNYLMQASAAEVLKYNLIKLDQAGLVENLIIPVHDEVVLQARKEDAKEIMHTVKECMTTREGWEIPLTSGVDGPFANWGVPYEKH